MLNSSVYICVRMCVGVCMFVYLESVDVGGPPGTVDAQAIHNNDFSQARISSQKNNCTPDNAEIYNTEISHCTTKAVCCSYFAASPSLVGGFVTSRPFCSRTALLFPLHPFIKWNGLLNRVLCRTDLFMFFFSFLKAVINIINI